MPSSCAGRILTLIPLVLLTTLSLTVIFVPYPVRAHTDSFLYKREHFQLARAVSSSSDTSASTTVTTSSSSATSSSSTSSSSVASSVSTNDVPSSSSSSSLQSAISSSSSSVLSPSTSSSSPVTSASSTSSSSSSSISSTNLSTQVSSSFSRFSSSPSTSISPGPSSSSSTTSVSAMPQVKSSSSQALPGTTFFTTSLTNDGQTFTSAIPVPTSNRNVSSSPKGFLANKAAVAGTFTVVGLVVVALGVALVVWLTKGKRRRSLEEEDYFERFSEPGMAQTSGLRGLGGLGPSSTDVTTAAVTNAYPDRTVHYGANNVDGAYNVADYGIDYPPGTSYPAVQDTSYHYDRSATQQGINRPIPSSPPGDQNFSSRTQYDHTVDSFYGGLGRSR